jgi:hypothetical protein
MITCTFMIELFHHDANKFGKKVQNEKKHVADDSQQH